MVIHLTGTNPLYDMIFATRGSGNIKGLVPKDLIPKVVEGGQEQALSEWLKSKGNPLYPYHFAFLSHPGVKPDEVGDPQLEIIVFSILLVLLGAMFLCEPIASTVFV